MAIMGLKIIKDTLTQGFQTYYKLAGIKGSGRATGAHRAAMRATVIQMLNWISNGSSRESRVPPIRKGILRGSGSAFVEDECVLTTRGQYQEGTPCESYDAGRNSMAVGFNTAYAARMHEGVWVPGGKVPSKQARTIPGLTGDVGNKFIELHLIADGKAAMETYAAVFKRETGA
jgi:hypothetical protein